MAIKTNYGSRQLLFKISLLGLLGLIGGYIYFFVSTKMVSKDIDAANIVLNEQNMQLTINRNKTGYNKIIAARDIDSEYAGNTPWSQNIPKIIEMLEELKNIDTEANELIVLSDFKVTLKDVSLNGKVSSLALLYKRRKSKDGTTVNKSLFEKFLGLGFLKDIRIQTYQKGDDGFKFTLNANVTNEGSEE